MICSAINETFRSCEITRVSLKINEHHKKVQHIKQKTNLKQCFHNFEFRTDVDGTSCFRSVLPPRGELRYCSLNTR